MQLVQAPERPLAALAVIAPFQQPADNNIRVVVTLLGALLKLSRPVKQGRYAGDAKGTKKRKFQCARRIKGKIVASREKNNTLVILLGIQPFNGTQNGVAGHVSFDTVFRLPYYYASRFAHHAQIL